MPCGARMDLYHIEFMQINISNLPIGEYIDFALTKISTKKSLPEKELHSLLRVV
jgi:hypothetical protein